MWTYHADLLARPVPRYTSFPTAAEFDEAVDAEAYAAALDAISDSTDVSLYVHIPFCEDICWYCGCNTARANKRSRVRNYVGALLSEIVRVEELLSGKALNVGRIAFGGGSPNALSGYEFSWILLALTQAFHAGGADISVEVDPRSLSEEWIEVLRGAGVRMVSLGVQTFSPRLQQMIGRVQDLETIARCTSLLRGAGVTSLNFDLMYGLPGQKLNNLRETLDTSLALAPDRIALFGYAHLPAAIPRQRQIDASDLPGPETRFQMANLGHEVLLGAGYDHVGFDHFAKPDDPLANAARSGRLHRNFQGFTDDAAEVVIGLGASAISKLPSLLVQNEKNIGQYRMKVTGNRLATSRGVVRTADDRWRAKVISDLLCNGEADISRLPVTWEEYHRLTPFRELGLVEMRDGSLVMSSDALPYARSVAAIFDPYRQGDRERFSQAV